MSPFVFASRFFLVDEESHSPIKPLEAKSAEGDPMRTLTGKSGVIRLSTLALGFVAASLGLAQQANTTPATTRYQITVVRLKPDMVDEWTALQKNEVIPAQKKAGVKERSIQQTTVGNSFEFTIVTPYPNFAAADGPGANERALGAEGAAKLAAKIRKCVDVQRTYLSNRVNDLYLDPGPAAASRLLVRKALPGKQDEFLAFIKADLLPAYKKAKADGKIAGFSVWTRGVGAPAGEIAINISYKKFADMDAGDPLVAVLGQAAVTKLNAKRDSLSTAVQQNIRRRVADLSF